MKSLTTQQARSFYDRFGIKQDAQAFYEDAALSELVSHSAFEQARSVFELGCGTGRFALRLLGEHLPASASYMGIDVSETMTRIAGQRLSPYRDRASVARSEGSMQFPLAARSVDRVVSTYVLDLLPDVGIRDALTEAHRVLSPHGKLCLVSLTQGATFASRIVSAAWSAAFHASASLVGGCRPIRLVAFLDPQAWSVDSRSVVTQWGVPSEVLVATPLRSPGR